MKTLLAGAQILKLEKIVQMSGAITLFVSSAHHSLEELQRDVDGWFVIYNHQRPHSGRYCYGNTPMQTFSVCYVSSGEIIQKNSINRGTWLESKHFMRQG
jgi:hypothetical protein